ncbi:Pentatricopeptide repeat-containing protein At1g77360, mitochondrial [Linum grandiflorum]
MENGRYNFHRRHGHLPQHSSTSPSSIPRRQQSSSSIFPSYTDIPNLPPKIKLICEIIATAPPIAVERVLDDACISVTQAEVEQVLKLSYAFPATSVKFFRWSGCHSPHAWNLVVDLLGKNRQFEAMWESVKSMSVNRLVSSATFASIFGSYVSAGMVKESIVSFEVMDRYGCNRDVVALNSLLSAICRDGKTVQAFAFLHVARNQWRICPDADSFAILLEGWEKEMNVISSRETFGLMIESIGWDPMNVPAYDSFLCTLISCSEGTTMMEVFNHLQRMKDKGCYPGIKFLTLALEDCRKRNDVESADILWETMVESAGIIKPDAKLYNVMILLYSSKNSEKAVKLLDEMVCKRVLPDAESYNGLFRFLIETGRLEEASALFRELARNNCILSGSNCRKAVEVFLGSRDGLMAIRVWESMERGYEVGLEETGNLLVMGLVKLGMVQEAGLCSERMLDKGIRLSSVTIRVLEDCLAEEREKLKNSAM